MMKFNEFVSEKDRMYSEMSKNKKKSQPNIAPKDRSPFGKITLQLGPTAIGHQGHISGTGVHDSRPKRQRTRGAAHRAAVKEHD